MLAVVMTKTEMLLIFCVIIQSGWINPCGTKLRFGNGDGFNGKKAKQK